MGKAYQMLQALLRNKVATAAGFGLVILALILREYFSGGVITHHLLAQEDLPGISNWWGLFSVTLLALVTLWLVDRRLQQHPETKAGGVFRAFFGALLFGIAMGLLWEFSLVELLSKAIWLPLLIALFLPVYRPEYLLGFVVGMAYTFGGILPIGIGLVLVIGAFLIYHLTRWVHRLLSK